MAPFWIFGRLPARISAKGCSSAWLRQWLPRSFLLRSVEMSNAATVLVTKADQLPNLIWLCLFSIFLSGIETRGKGVTRLSCVAHSSTLVSSLAFGVGPCISSR